MAVWMRRTVSRRWAEVDILKGGGIGVDDPDLTVANENVERWRPGFAFLYVVLTATSLSCNWDSDERWWRSANSTRDKSGRDKPTRLNCLFFATGQENSSAQDRESQT